MTTNRDGSQRAFRVVQQATTGKREHRIVQEETVGHTDGTAHHIIRCSCTGLIEHGGLTPAAAKLAARKAWHEHAT